jgi:hypothetical protein
MGRNLANWNHGMSDAESGKLAAIGRTRDYYDGYDYAYASNYEYVEGRFEGLMEEEPDQVETGSGVAAASGFSVSLHKLSAALSGKPPDKGADKRDTDILEGVETDSVGPTVETQIGI